MIGRAAYKTPWQLLGAIDLALYDTPPPHCTRYQVLMKYKKYCVAEMARNPRTKFASLFKPIMPLFLGEAKNQNYRACLHKHMRSSSLPVDEVLMIETCCIASDFK